MKSLGQMKIASNSSTFYNDKKKRLFTKFYYIGHFNIYIHINHNLYINLYDNLS